MGTFELFDLGDAKVETKGLVNGDTDNHGSLGD